MLQSLQTTDLHKSFHSQPFSISFWQSYSEMFYQKRKKLGQGVREKDWRWERERMCVYWGLGGVLAVIWLRSLWAALKRITFHSPQLNTCTPTQEQTSVCSWLHVMDLDWRLYVVYCCHIAHCVFKRSATVFTVKDAFFFQFNFIIFSPHSFNVIWQ